MLGDTRTERPFAGREMERTALRPPPPHPTLPSGFIFFYLFFPKMNQTPLPSIQGPRVFPCWLLQHFPCPRKNVILARIRKSGSRREGTSPVTPAYIYFFSRCTFISSTGVHLFLQIYFLTTAGRCGARSACSQQSAESFYVLESPLCPFKTTTKKMCVQTQNAT